MACMAVRCLRSPAMDIMRVVLASGAMTITRVATACGEIFTEERACVYTVQFTSSKSPIQDEAMVTKLDSQQF